MTSHFKNTIPVVYLLFCLFITSVSAHSFIRQFTDGNNANLQQKSGAGLLPTLENADYSHKRQEISSRNYKLSATNAMTGLRNRRPSSYSLKMESFNTLLNSRTAEGYESRPFTVGGYNWTLVVYPKGNTRDSGSGFLSLYVAIDNSSLIASHEDVYADLRFYIYNKKERKYFTIQDTDVWKFNVFKTMWGFPKVLSVDTFKDPSNGYLYDGDHCEFGVDVTIPSRFEISELFSVTQRRDIYNPRYTWSIRSFSTLLGKSYTSDVFNIAGRKWNILVFPNSFGTTEGKFFSMYLSLNETKELRTNEKIYCRAKLRVLNQRQLNNVEKEVDKWFTLRNNAWGFAEMTQLSDLRDPSKGFLVNDVVMVQVEIETVSSTKYFPR